jgi:hypothetical protein
LLKQAWHKAKEILPESAVEYIEGARYIKLDGTPYHAKGIKSFLHRPEVKIGTLALAFNAAVGIAYGLSSVELAQVTVFNMATIPAFSYLFRYSCLLGSKILEKNKAIDTLGKDLSRSQLSNGDVKELKVLALASVFWGGVLSVLAFGAGTSGTEENVSHTMPSMGIFLPSMVTYISGTMALLNRSQKLLNNDYCFCDKPPAERKKQARETWAMGGMQQQPLKIAVPAKHKL